MILSEPSSVSLSSIPYPCLEQRGELLVFCLHSILAAPIVFSCLGIVFTQASACLLQTPQMGMSGSQWRMGSLMALTW